MMTRIECGDLLCSPVSTARFIVVAAGTAVEMPTVDGVPLAPSRPQPCAATRRGQPFPLRGGQRYVDTQTGLIIMCVQPGDGALQYAGRSLTTEHAPRRRTFSSVVSRGSSRQAADPAATAS
jgi:hypothetical protein